ncbi:MAG: 50S ribosomal protein L7/L12 [Pirellulaceae bacterium]|nr:MAG: 50S ribosomal protein L7/L12 [Pirellulaceae bacterium]
MATATKEFSPKIRELGDQIVALTLKECIELGDYLEEVHNIKPAVGGAVVMAPPTAQEGAAQVEEQTEFDVILTNFGPKKLDVVKVVKNLTGLSLMDAKKLVETPNAKIKEKVSKDEAQKVKAQLEELGATVELK